MQFGNVVYFLVWAAMIFLMMRFGCGAHVMGHSRHGESDSSRKAPKSSVDPVCGMTLSTQSAKSAFYAGHAYYFCSSNCRDKFEAAPASYAVPSSPSEGHHHAC